MARSKYNPAQIFKGAPRSARKRLNTKVAAQNSTFPGEIHPSTGAAPVVVGCGGPPETTAHGGEEATGHGGHMAEQGGHMAVTSGQTTKTTVGLGEVRGLGRATWPACWSEVVRRGRVRTSRRTSNQA